MTTDSGELPALSIHLEANARKIRSEILAAASVEGPLVARAGEGLTAALDAAMHEVGAPLGAVLTTTPAGALRVLISRRSRHVDTSERPLHSPMLLPLPLLREVLEQRRAVACHCLIYHDPFHDWHEPPAPPLPWGSRETFFTFMRPPYMFIAPLVAADRPVGVLWATAWSFDRDPQSLVAAFATAARRVAQALPASASPRDARVTGADPSGGPLSVGPYRLQGIADACGDALDPRGRPVRVSFFPKGERSGRFFAALQALARRSHAHVALSDIGFDDRWFYWTREAFSTSARRRLDLDGPMWPDRAIEVIAQIATALEAFHAEGGVHGRVDPATIWLEPGRGALLDGFAPEASAGPYRAPESEPQPTSDVYTLAMTAFTLLTGEYPFVSDDPSERMSDAPTVEIGRRLPERIVRVWPPGPPDPTFVGFIGTRVRGC